MSRNRTLIGLGLIIVAYTTLHAFGYAFSILGQSPHLDGAETLRIAQQLYEGKLPHTPFYRAMLYPGMLSLLLRLGLDTHHLPGAALIMGLLFHWISTYLVGRIALRIWAHLPAALFAAGLYGMYPVALHFLVDPVDITFAISLFLAAVFFAVHPRRKSLFAALSGAMLALAVCARPHFAIVFPVIAAGMIWIHLPDRKAWIDLLCFALGACLVLVSYGFWNQAHGGIFRVLPTQGAYNFHAANRTGAHGKYYQQSVYIPPSDASLNPAQAASIREYVHATGQPVPTQALTLEKYWKERSKEMIREDPFQWFGKLIRKSVYLLNDYEQYNNKTYSFHKQRSPTLKYNPLGWFVLLTLSALSIGFLWRSLKRLHFLLIILILVYAAGVILYYTSGRFRLPLTPLLCILSGGIVFLPRLKPALRTVGIGVLIVTVVGLISLPNWWNARDPASKIQDMTLIANAHARLNQDSSALQWSLKALKTQPEKPDARRIACISFFNLQLERAATGAELLDWMGLQPYARPVPAGDPVWATVCGLILWNTGSQEAAMETWHQVVAGSDGTSELAIALLLLTRAEPSFRPQALRYATKHPRNGMLRTILDAVESHPAETSPAVITLNRLLGNP